MPAMTKITTKSKPADPTCINIDDAGEVTRWARHFGINEAQLKTFVQAVGPMVADVQQEIERTP